MSAAHVLSIFEILQQILCEVPPLDIIQCRRVNSTWKQLIVVANILKHLPEDARYQFDPLSGIDQHGFGGYLSLRPILLRDLMQWYERNKATEHSWGKMPLCRPDARKIVWEIPNTEGAGMPVELEAIPVPAEYDDPNPDGYAYRVNKAPGQPLILTVGDLMKNLDWAWERWVDSEHECHYLSHDESGCDYDRGIPGEGCLGDKEEDSDEEEDEETFGTKMTLEAHIEQAMNKASS